MSTPAEDMRATINDLEREALRGVVVGDGFEREGETQDSPPPSYVLEGADPELCKEALEHLSRHLLTEIQALIKRKSKFKNVFDIPSADGEHDA